MRIRPVLRGSIEIPIRSVTKLAALNIERGMIGKALSKGNLTLGKLMGRSTLGRLTLANCIAASLPNSTSPFSGASPT